MFEENNKSQRYYTALLDKYISIYHNKYVAVSKISQDARKLMTSVGNRILESEAIRWLATGDKPEWLNNSKTNDKRMLNQFVTDNTIYILDKQVKQCVRVSLHKSDECNHLIFVYSSDMNEYQKQRVRIICRILWNKLNLEL